MAFLLVFVFISTLSIFSCGVSGHNITDILSGFPEYEAYNKFLTQTKLCDDINSHDTITVLVLTNAEMTALAGKHPLSVVKNALSLHVLLDYYDPKKLHQISEGTTLTTTLYQTTGHAPGKVGFVNITDMQGGKVGFGSAIPGSKLDSTYTKSVKQFPYTISVLEISQPIIAQAIMTAPAPSASDVNITALLEKAGCKTFASLIVVTGVIKTFQSAIEKGLTIFAPNDEAFKADGVPDLSKLTSVEEVSLLLFHSLATYTPYGTLKTNKDPMSTLATNGAGKYALTTRLAGDSVTLHTGVDSARVADKVLDSPPLCIFTVDSILLPPELYGTSPTPSPAPVPAPEPVASPAPAPAPTAEAPSPFAASPPAPPSEAAEGSPDVAPVAESRSSKHANAGVAVKAPTLTTALLVVFSYVIYSVLLS